MRWITVSWKKDLPVKTLAERNLCGKKLLGGLQRGQSQASAVKIEFQKHLQTKGVLLNYFHFRGKFRVQETTICCGDRLRLTSQNERKSPNFPINKYIEHLWHKKSKIIYHINDNLEITENWRGMMIAQFADEINILLRSSRWPPQISSTRSRGRTRTHVHEISDPCLTHQDFID